MNETVHFEDVLERYGKLVYPNKGVSMLPLLRQGRDLMVIERKNGESFKKYDAVLFRRPNARGRDDYVLHRILRVNEDGSYWIVGDNCCTGDTVREDQILGTLTAVLRDGKKAVLVTAPLCRAYVALWCGCYPVRFAVIRAKYFAFGCLRRLKKLVTH